MQTSTLTEVIRWRLIIEEYGPDLRYVKGAEKAAADPLSSLGLKNNPEFNNKLEQCLFYAFCSNCL